MLVAMSVIALMVLTSLTHCSYPTRNINFHCCSYMVNVCGRGETFIVIWHKLFLLYNLAAMVIFY